MSEPVTETRIPRALRRARPGALPARQRGVALLVAILLVALGTVIAAALAYDNAMTARRTLAALNYDQALLVTEGMEAFAAYGLQQTYKNDQTHTTYPAQAWGQPLGPLEIAPGVTIEASLEDLEGRFNLNDLIEPDGVTPDRPAIVAFQRLLESVGLEPKWAEDVVNWIDRNPSPPFPEAPSDTAYLEMDPPYHTPDLPITSTSELLALPGFGRANFQKIAPFISALPVNTPLNICSASPEVLNAVLGHREYSDPKQFYKDRAAAGGCFPTLQEFSAAYTNTVPGGLSGGNGGFGGNARPVNFALPINTTSSWFRLSTFVSAGSTEFAFYSLLYRDPGNGMVRPILRSDTPN